MALGPDSRIGGYEIVALLGAGGMGEVYRARDTKLNRDVALKILPDTFAVDAERIARFRREAQVLASLNHPNIAAIYGFEDSGTIHALVLELVEGPTLADRLERGPIPIDEALAIATQIADALEAAHEQGIVHRDLKPANIKVRDDGTVKVLDFGLAKALESSSSLRMDLTNSPTITSPAMMTGIGTILGTAAYMSPEQAKGRPADKRSDVWAYGCVLYEMLAGKRAFDGEDVSDTLANILKTEPDWTALPASVPSSIALVVTESLRKNRAERIADLSTVLFVLRQPALVPQPAIADRRSTRASYALIAAACLGLGVLVTMVAMYVVTPPARSSPITRLTIPLGPSDSFSAAGRHVVALSPDAAHLVYVANNQLYIRALNQLDAVPLRKTGGENRAFGREPFFSPDGKWVGFWQDGKLRKVLVDGGTPVDICQADIPFGATWSDENTIVYSGGTAGIFRVSPNGGEPELIVRNPGGIAHGPQLLPDGHSVLFTLRKEPNRWDDADIVVESVVDHHRDVVVRGATDARYLDTGHLVFVSNGTLFGQRFSLASLKVDGVPVALVQGVAQSTIQTGAAHFSVARSGTLAYIPGTFQTTVTTSTLVWVDRQGRETPLKAPARRYLYPRVSPEGTRVAAGIRTDDGSGSEDIWIWSMTSETLSQLTSGKGRHIYPTWTPDGHRIAFGTTLIDEPGIWWQAADGSAPAEQMVQETAVPTSFTPSGDKLVMNRFSKEPLGVLTIGAKRPPDSVTTGTADRNGEVSPNGRWLAYESDGAGTTQVFVRPFDTKQTRRWQVSTAGGRNPLWRRDGRELFFVDPMGTLMRVAVTDALEWTASLPAKLIDGRYSLSLSGIAGRLYDVSRDGQQLLVLKPVSTPNEQRGPDRIVIVQNWFEELKARLPVK
jgi:serine/threonine-protein kinase